MVPRLCVPEIHSLWARNWNFAASGAAFTASRVANRVAVSTPLRVDSLTVAVMVMLLLWLVGRSGGLQLEVPDVPGRDQVGFGVHRPAELLLQLDELRHRGVGGQLAGQLEDLAQGEAAQVLVAGQRGALTDLAAEHPV